METIIRVVEDIEKDYEIIREGAEYIKKGQLVAFPTETVYGLGANALDAGAVRRIFEAKGRPSDNPLIVHIGEIDDINELVAHIPSSARLLMDKYWPGPLTLVLKKSSSVPAEVTAGLDTVAIRMPSHPVANALIRESGVPIAAPSANKSGRPSPTLAKHVIEDLSGRIPFIIDGGECSVGLESTVLDMSRDTPIILRPGGITKEMIEDTIGSIEVDRRVLTPPMEGEEIRSPGMKYTHYAPNAPVVIVEGNIDYMADKIRKVAKYYSSKYKKIIVLSTEETALMYGDEDFTVFIMGSRAEPSTIASNLFALLRECDERNADIIIAEGVEETHEGLAIMNRMLRAAAFRVIK